MEIHGILGCSVFKRNVSAHECARVGVDACAISATLNVLGTVIRIHVEINKC